MGRTPEGKKKRTNHNELERKRRQTQKSTMMELRDVIPVVEGEKLSTISVLTRAREHIASLEAKIQAQEAELASLRKKPKLESGEESSAAASTSTTPVPAVTVTPPPTSQETKSPGFLKKLEPLKKENQSLKEQVEALERQLGVKSESAEGESHFAVDPNLLSAANQVLSS